MRLPTVLGSAICAIAIGATAPTATAECDISAAKCAQNDNKCNIHFKNRTGDWGGSDGSSSLSQHSLAQSVAVKAVDSHNNRVGNKLVIQAGDKKTMNISKKANKGFDAIRISSDSASGVVDSTKISCAEIIEVLDGSGICKLFHGSLKRGEEVASMIGYQCDGGYVGGP